MTPLNSFCTSTSCGFTSGTDTRADSVSAVSAGPGSQTWTARMAPGMAAVPKAADRAARAATGRARRIASILLGGLLAVAGLGRWE